MDLKLALESINAQIQQLPLNKQPKELYEPVSYFMAIGGKRMRPLLAMIGCYMFDDNYDKALKPAVAIELFHNFTLIHDDIMDNAPLRRGVPTVHEKWNRNIAILAGDITMIQAYEMLAHSPENIRSEIYHIFNRTAAEVCEGQQIDMNFENRSDVSIDEYIHMISLKTAVLLGCSMYIGARIGGADVENAQKIYDAALNMGISFQIKDDLLDVFGEAAKVGKMVGGDIVANKKTYLLLKAFEKASLAQKQSLNQLLTDTCISPEDKVGAVTEIYNQLSIRLITEQAIRHYFDVALNQIAALDTSEHKKKYLAAFFTDLMNRDK